MKQMIGAAALLAIAFAASPYVGAQTPAGTAKPADQQAKPADQQMKGGKQITVTGCVQRETDYRAAQDKGRGGVAGTGIGAADEFVLTNAVSGGGGGAAAPSAGASQGAGMAYELTGENEKLAKGHVGHRVEITGMLKEAETGPAGKPTGGATAGTPPGGVDVLSKDLRLRELEVTALKMVSADCPK